MIPNHIAISPTELARFVSGHGLAHQAHGLLDQQKTTWEMLRRGYDSLTQVRTRAFDFDGFQLKVQFNPGRLTSTAAKVDPKSIRERKCFLCGENLPALQRGIVYRASYVVLCNPFPIFPEHFTIAALEHTPQRIVDAFGTLLELTREMGERYTVFYNGPRCGASAPDHLHFQAGDRSFVPIDAEYSSLTRSVQPFFASNGLRAYAIERCLRQFVSLESAHADALSRAFGSLYEVLAADEPAAAEPLLNVLCFYEGGQWRVLCFPRVKHRPAFYFLEGEAQLMFSPAAVEMGGICTTPREQDFENVTRDQLVGMFAEVCVSPQRLAEITARLTPKL